MERQVCAMRQTLLKVTKVLQALLEERDNNLCTISPDSFTTKGSFHLVFNIVNLVTSRCLIAKPRYNDE